MNAVWYLAERTKPLINSPVCFPNPHEVVQSNCRPEESRMQTAATAGRSGEATHDSTCEPNTHAALWGQDLCATNFPRSGEGKRSSAIPTRSRETTEASFDASMKFSCSRFVEYPGPASSIFPQPSIFAIREILRNLPRIHHSHFLHPTPSKIHQHADRPLHLHPAR